MSDQWRVVLEGGEVRDMGLNEVQSDDRTSLWTVDSSHPRGAPRAVLLESCMRRGLAVQEIVAPGELTRAEAVAAEREACAAICDAAYAEAGGAKADAGNFAASRIRDRSTPATEGASKK